MSRMRPFTDPSGVPLVAKHLKNSHASETPVTDGRNTYAYLDGACTLFAVDFDGKVVWSTDVKQPEVRADLSSTTQSLRSFLGDLVNIGAVGRRQRSSGRICIVNGRTPGVVLGRVQYGQRQGTLARTSRVRETRVRGVCGQSVRVILRRIMRRI